MSRARVVLLLVAVPLLVIAWWLGSPLFLDRRVSEAFPTSEHAEQASTGGTVASPVRLAVGTFQDQDAIHRGAGEVSLHRLADGSHVLRFEDFEVTNGPDLKVIVSPGRSFANHGELDAAGWVELEALKGNVGNQNYVLPSSVDIDELGSVIIWCKAFSVIFSVASLERG
jgi:hypothetical protein